MTVVESGLRVVMPPQAVPLEIPAEGGSFSYTLVLENHTDATQTFDAWVNLTGPANANFTRGPVPVLADGERAAGRHVVVWNAAGHPTGPYFLRLEAGRDTFTRAMLLMK